tara:strand:+ start:292 stop:534 length:243 start_codon:yes stop_codon:yes gene_type:complete
MADKTTVLDQQFSTPAELLNCAFDLHFARQITRMQAMTIVRQASPHLPGRVLVEQRTPLGILYVAACEHAFDVSRRGRVL